MPPTAPIDSDMLGRHVLYVLEKTALWKATNFGAGDASWEKILDAATYSSELPGLQFSRIRAYGSTLYVLGGTVPDAAAGDAYFFRSRTSGLSWTYSLIASASFEIKPYTMDVQPINFGFSLPFGTPTQLANVVHKRWDGEQARNPWAMGYTFAPQTGMNSNGTGPWYTTIIWQGDYPSAANSLMPGVTGTHDAETGPFAQINNLCNSSEKVLARSYLDDYFGAGNWVRRYAWDYEDMPLDAIRVNMGFRCGQTGMTQETRDQTHNWMGASYALFRYPNPLMPTALDAALTNPDWVYVGCEDKVFKTEDGGYTWIELITDRGAHDVCVDPEQAGTVYMWATNGELNVVVNGAVNATLDTESPLRLPLRLARNRSDARLLAIRAGAELRLRVDGTWTTLKADLLNGTGLHWYGGRKLILADDNNVWISDNDGTNIYGKKGAWGFSGPKNAHRMSD